jgi:hypothetical protein
MKKLVTIAALLSLGLALPVYAADTKADTKAVEPAKTAAEPAKAADATAAVELTGKDGKCMMGDKEVTVKDGKVMEGDKEAGAAPTGDKLPKECAPK